MQNTQLVFKIKDLKYTILPQTLDGTDNLKDLRVGVNETITLFRTLMTWGSTIPDKLKGSFVMA
jgi:hypothetical protein